MLRIGDFSKLSRISIRMLRHYDEIGLLIPKSIDSCTNYRYYSEEQLVRASRILALKSFGFSIAVTIEILNHYHDADEFYKLLAIKQKEILVQFEGTKHQLQLLDTTMKRLKEEGNSMEYNVVLKEMKERYVASVRKTIDSYQCEGQLWGILMKETAHLKMKDGEPCYTLAIFHDKEYKENDVDVEVQKTVIGKYENTENVVFKVEPAVQIASATYKGSYEQMAKVNEAVAHWVYDNGYEFGGAMFNIYHVSPHETQNPEEMVTEVCYPVKKK